MTLTNLPDAAAKLSAAWRSDVLARIGGANIKVLRMDAAPLADESHDYPEGLLVLDGHMDLTMGGETIRVGPGEIYVVPPGTVHGVAPGSTGTLVIFDREP